MTHKLIKTRIKLLPTILRLFIGLVGTSLLVVTITFSIKLIEDPTAFAFVSVLMFSFMGFFFMGLGPVSIATFSIDGITLTENIFGLIKIRTELAEIQCYSIRLARNGFGSFDQLILNKRDGQTIFINSFDQADFEAFHLEIENLLPHDFKAKPNYWTKFYKVAAIWLGLWEELMIIFIIIRVMKTAACNGYKALLLINYFFKDKSTLYSQALVTL